MRPPVESAKCHPCVRNTVLPISQEGQHQDKATKLRSPTIKETYCPRCAIPCLSAKRSPTVRVGEIFALPVLFGGATVKITVALALGALLSASIVEADISSSQAKRLEEGASVVRELRAI